MKKTTLFALIAVMFATVGCEPAHEQRYVEREDPRYEEPREQWYEEDDDEFELDIDINMPAAKTKTKKVFIDKNGRQITEQEMKRRKAQSLRDKMKAQKKRQEAAKKRKAVQLRKAVKQRKSYSAPKRKATKTKSRPTRSSKRR